MLNPCYLFLILILFFFDIFTALGFIREHLSKTLETRIALDWGVL